MKRGYIGAEKVQAQLTNRPRLVMSDEHAEGEAGTHIWILNAHAQTLIECPDGNRGSRPSLFCSGP